MDAAAATTPGTSAATAIRLIICFDLVEQSGIAGSLPLIVNDHAVESRLYLDRTLLRKKTFTFLSE
jgi:hypothetical protein